MCSDNPQANDVFIQKKTHYIYICILSYSFIRFSNRRQEIHRFFSVCLIRVYFFRLLLSLRRFNKRLFRARTLLAENKTNTAFVFALSLSRILSRRVCSIQISKILTAKLLHFTLLIYYFFSIFFVCESKRFFSQILFLFTINSEKNISKKFHYTQFNYNAV